MWQERNRHHTHHRSNLPLTLGALHRMARKACVTAGSPHVSYPVGALRRLATLNIFLPRQLCNYVVLPLCLELQLGMRLPLQ
jgi:hypothetical protein